jgi:hypothetical protein
MFVKKFVLKVILMTEKIVNNVQKIVKNVKIKMNVWNVWITLKFIKINVLKNVPKDFGIKMESAHNVKIIVKIVIVMDV